MRKPLISQRHRYTVRDLRRDNRSALLWALFEAQPCTRQDLGVATGLSPASVSTAVRDLIAEGVVAEAGPLESNGGRPSVLLRMNPGYGQVVGIDVGETRISAEMYDLTMARLARAEHLLDPRRHGPEMVADRIAQCLALLLDDAASERSVFGVGIGVPGAVELDAGGRAIVHAQSYGWEAAPLERLLRDRVGGTFPLLFDNGAKALAQAELWFGAAGGARRAVVCLVGSGAGASVIADGTATAIEWGHTTIVAGGRGCRCGSHGCLEAYIGAEAILDRYGQPAPDGNEEAALTALVTSTSAAARAVLDETASYLGIGIANLINVFNPDRVILSGWAGQLLAERSLPLIEQAARTHALRHTYAATTITRGDLGPDAVALGAATLPLTHFLSP
jgi:predicted NBD/HSP70 family sugar kinase